MKDKKEGAIEVFSNESGKRNKVLLAEENKIAQKILHRELDSLDAEIIIARDGWEAIRLAGELSPNVITTEIDLPGMGGFEICRKLKNSYNTRDIPVIFVTHVDSEEDRKKAYEVGAVDYCVAPFKPGELASKIKKLLEVWGMRESRTILIAEDSETIMQITSNILKKQGHEVLEARDGLEAWKILQERDDIDLIISDINMPNMDGHQLCRKIRLDSKWEFVPIIICSTLADKEDIVMLLNSGADDYVIKPFSAEEFLARIKAHMRVKELYNDLNRANDKLQAFNISLEKMVEARTHQLHEANMEAITMLAVASEFRDTDTGSHVRRIAKYSREIALAMGYSESKADEISYSSILHDVGKIAIPDSILKKGGSLTDDEFETMKKHTVHGEKILSDNKFFKMGKDVARWHHEKFDGTGYPDGFSEYSIPLSSRIVAVADVFDALTTERVYKKAWAGGKAHKEIMKLSGKHFDPLVVDAFDNLYKEGVISTILKKYESDR